MRDGEHSYRSNVTTPKTVTSSSQTYMSRRDDKHIEQHTNILCFIQMRRTPRSSPLYSSAASDVYQRPIQRHAADGLGTCSGPQGPSRQVLRPTAASDTHLRAHETPEQRGCRLLPYKKKRESGDFRVTIYDYKYTYASHTSALLYSPLYTL